MKKLENGGIIYSELGRVADELVRLCTRYYFEKTRFKVLVYLTKGRHVPAFLTIYSETLNSELTCFRDVY